MRSGLWSLALLLTLSSNASAAPAESGWLGAKLKDEGQRIVIDGVVKGAPAQKAGLRKGDVLAVVDGKPVTTLPELLRWIGSHRPGSRLTIEVRRGGKSLRLTALLAKSSQAMSFYKKACEGGDVATCSELGRRCARGEGVPVDTDLAAYAWRRGCDGGDMDSCAGLGVIHMRGTGAAQDLPEAVRLLLKACDGGSMNGCANLGYLYARGDGVIKDATKAAKLCKKACDADEPAGCKNLGVMYEEGNGLKKDPAQALELYKRACKRGSTEACQRHTALEAQRSGR
jgi:hypothetical protein